jgi:hypothetical protein
MEIQEKLDLLQSNPRQAIEAEEKRYVNLPPEKNENFSDFKLHQDLVGKGWLHL